MNTFSDRPVDLPFSVSKRTMQLSQFLYLLQTQ